MNILITGGLGYIGSNVISKLLKVEEINKILIVDNLSSSEKEILEKFENISGKEIVFLKKSIGKLKKKDLKKHRLTHVIHFAGLISVEESTADPISYYDNNVAQSINLLKLCKKLKINNFIFSSTASVYESSNDPVKENSKTNPLSPYSNSKLIFESILKDYNEINKDFNLIILRYFNVAGASDNLKFGQTAKKATHLIRVAAKVKIGELKSISIFGTDYNTKDGTCIRDYIHIEDLAEAHILALNKIKKITGTFNIGSGTGYSVKEVIDTINNLEIEVKERRAGDSEKILSNTTKAKEILGFIVKKDIKSICDSAIAWERSQKKD